MKQRVRLITLGVSDLGQVRRFYEALGWSTGAQPGDDVVFFQAGATIGREPAETFWGGYSGIFVDRDGHPWEVAHNPHWTITEGGGVRLG
jgi:predicted lactoylglutathione lyase